MVTFLKYQVWSLDSKDYMIIDVFDNFIYVNCLSCDTLQYLPKEIFKEAVLVNNYSFDY